MTLFSHSQERLFDSVSIALVGKYTDLKDSYMSVIKALEHSAFRCHRKLILHVCHPLCNEVLCNHNIALTSGWNHRICNQNNRTQILKNITTRGELLLAQGNVLFDLIAEKVFIYSPAVSSFQAGSVNAALKV